MINRLSLLLSALFMLGFLLPALLIYVISTIIFVAVADPTVRLYRFCRYGIQTSSLESA